MLTTLRRYTVGLALSGLTLLGWGVPSPAQPDRIPPQDLGQEVQPLTRGPVHEAFAQPVTFDPKPGLIVPRQPPGPIDEAPPDQKPAGDNVMWIAGYWGWDEGRNDYIWVSGFWRTMPPGRHWTPGAWAPTAEGFQWVSGYWAPDDVQQPEVLPPPPESLEVGPSTAAPAADSVWSPGYWSWRSERYAWCPGYWFAPRAAWIWTPPQYVWGPGGCTFVAGYWDYALPGRGLLFAPVAFTSTAYVQPAYRFCPSVCLDVGGLFDSLFCWPRYRHYCFGDYYAPACAQAGIVPWFAVQRRGYGCDPLFNHYRAWHGRTDPNWAGGLAATFHYRQQHAEARPPMTFAAHRQWVNRPAGPVAAPHLARPLHELATVKGGPVALETVPPQQRQHFAQAARGVREVQERRLRGDNAVTRPAAAPAPTRPAVAHDAKPGPAFTAPRSQPAAPVLPQGPQARDTRPVNPLPSHPGGASAAPKTDGPRLMGPGGLTPRSHAAPPAPAPAPSAPALTKPAAPAFAPPSAAPAFKPPAVAPQAPRSIQPAAPAVRPPTVARPPVGQPAITRPTFSQRPAGQSLLSRPPSQPQFSRPAAPAARPQAPAGNGNRRHR